MPSNTNYIKLALAVAGGILLAVVIIVAAGMLLYMLSLVPSEGPASVHETQQEITLPSFDSDHTATRLRTNFSREITGIDHIDESTCRVTLLSSLDESYARELPLLIGDFFETYTSATPEIQARYRDKIIIAQRASDRYYIMRTEQAAAP